MIKIVTNNIPGGWEPQEIEHGLGGGEEVIVLFSKELAKLNYHVEVYYTPSVAICEHEYNGVIYNPLKYFSCTADDIVIMWKTRDFRILNQKPKALICWSSDVEQPIDPNFFDYFINFTKFHESRNPWVPSEKSLVFPLGIDLKVLDKNKCEAEAGNMLYCSSPDRGLPRLLEDWGTILKHYPTLQLNITYGFQAMLKFGGPRRMQIIRILQQEMKQKNINFLDKVPLNVMAEMYWKAEFWVLPLPFPDCELFCLSAMKARYCACIPVVKKIGGLNETVGSYIDYDDFIGGSNNNFRDLGAKPLVPVSWATIISDYWKPLLSKFD